MKLSLKQKAVLITTGMVAGAIIGVHLIRFIFQNVSIEVLINAAGMGICGFFLYMLYQITLSRLEYNEMTKEFAKKD
jgi:NhaP-type Na+/H+ or K+/H+ antiporter